jgi:hypothetical protein
MSSRIPLATSGVDNVHVKSIGKTDAVTKPKEKTGSEAGTKLEREVNTHFGGAVSMTDHIRYKH